MRALSLHRCGSDQSNEAALDGLAIQKATAAIGLLHLGRDDEIWPLLRTSIDPRLRAILIDSMAEYDCPASTLVDRLKSESDVSVRTALLLSLTGFDFADIPLPTRDVAVAVLQSLFLSDSDSGVHSAADLLLRRWGFDDSLSDLNTDVAGKRSTVNRWMVDRHGHTLAVVQGPVEFSMGSLPHTIDRTTTRKKCVTETHQPHFRSRDSRSHR